jgi:hypothetical protein
MKKETKPRIKFSHNYTKLQNNIFITLRRFTSSKHSWYYDNIGNIFDVQVKEKIRFQAKLLFLTVVHYESLSKYLIEYDTDNVYDLPKTELILLLFKKEK